MVHNQDRLYIEFYYDYKRNRGYTDTEIRNKREALENVLVPYRSDENYALLRRCGFASADSFFRWYNFESLIAVKGGPGRNEALGVPDFPVGLGE